MQAIFKPNHPKEEEPPILRSEVQQAVKASSRNKVTEIEGITTEAILACTEMTITWLIMIFHKGIE